MRWFILTFFVVQSVLATDRVLPKFPDSPTVGALLSASGLAEHSEEELVDYITGHGPSIAAWLPSVVAEEEDVIARQYLQLLDSGRGLPSGFWRDKTAELTARRLQDPRRIVDAVLRDFGERGSTKYIWRLLETARSLEENWARWKIYASVQRTLERVDPETLDPESLHHVDLQVVAPLLRDLPEDSAGKWAGALWKSWHQWLSPFLESKVSLQSRLWLARYLAAKEPKMAAEIFRRGLQSNDAAVRTLAVMLLRQGIGKSLPMDVTGESLVELLESGEWKSSSANWEIFPEPLDEPFLVGGRGSGRFLGRADLVWFDASAGIKRRVNDVWPHARTPLPNGLLYSRAGDVFPMTQLLTDPEGKVFSRFVGLMGEGVVAAHGGLWTATQDSAKATEFASDGSVLWELPLVQADFRMVSPFTAGRVLLLGCRSLECRDRRGDLIWKTSLEGLDDPRYIVPAGNEKFLLSCGKSFGWLSKSGTYTPLLERLGSPLWIRYHPSANWVVFDGADCKILIYDPASAVVTGRFDLDDGGEKAISKFASDSPFLE